MKKILSLFVLTLKIVCVNAQTFGYGFLPGGVSWGYHHNAGFNVVVIPRQSCHWEYKTYTIPVTVYTMTAPGVYLLYDNQYVTHTELRTYTLKEWVCY
jgi:hypothetical protein